MPFFLPPKTLENLAGPLRRDRIRAFKVLQLCAYVAVFGVTLLVFVHLFDLSIAVDYHSTAYASPLSLSFCLTYCRLLG